MALQNTVVTGITSASFNSLGNSLTVLGSSSPITPNITNNVADHHVAVTVNVGAITPSTLTVVNVFVAASVDGSKYSGNATTAEVIGSDAVVTLSAFGNNLVPLGQIVCASASVSTASAVFSVASAFGGIMPVKYVILIQNQTGLALGSTGNTVSATEKYYT